MHHTARCNVNSSQSAYWSGYLSATKMGALALIAQVMAQARLAGQVASSSASMSIIHTCRTVLDSASLAALSSYAGSGSFALMATQQMLCLRSAVSRYKAIVGS